MTAYLLNRYSILQVFSIYFILSSSLASWLPQKILSSLRMSQQSSPVSIFSSTTLPSWNKIKDILDETSQAKFMNEQIALREQGQGLPHPDAKIRLFDSEPNTKPRVVFFRDTAAWCPYCQKVWMLLEEKKIPYEVSKINMRSYGDKPPEFLRLVPNGLLPAIMLDGKLQTESLDIMLNLDSTFSSPKHPSMWPSDSSPEASRARSLMRLERDLFGRWCDLVFRPSIDNGARKRFEDGLDTVNRELGVTDGPWFLSTLSIADLTYLSHIERMCASAAFWSGLKIRGSGKWPLIDRWFDAFEERPSYLATKSDYYTHVQDIPPQYGPGYSVAGSEAYQRIILGDDNHWKLPLAPFTGDDLEPVSPRIDPGEEAARNEAAFKLINNHENIIRFALRGAGQPGKKRFQVLLVNLIVYYHS
jgi:glutathione S-transferase